MAKEKRRSHTISLTPAAWVTVDAIDADEDIGVSAAIERIIQWYTAVQRYQSIPPIDAPRLNRQAGGKEY